ncbi:MAG: carbohydrate kinase family protein [Anaerolineae bacterium]|nr:carbohydrate kinase family protein [Anaerolineae bacterium]
MTLKSHPVIAAGHTCLDIIPVFPDDAPTASLVTPGGMRQVGPAVLATGGSATNTGLALHRLGIPVRVMGKVGDDGFGRLILEHLRSYDPALAAGMLVAPGEHSSYTVILSAPGMDRAFLHYPGCNDTFCAGDVPDPAPGPGVFHFGYPSLMRRMYQDGGRELVALLRRMRARGLVTSLDMTMPDPNTEAGRVDWPALLANLLPHVDLFLPNLEETLFMLERDRFVRMKSQGDILPQITGDDLTRLGGRLRDMGAAIAGLKLGDQGMSLHTTADASHWASLAGALDLDAGAWAGRELLAPAFRVTLVGATGAGDCAIAGFIAGLLAYRAPEPVLTGAVAVGACNVEAADAVSGVPSWEAVQRRIAAGWEQRPLALKLDGWRWDAPHRLWAGPNDPAG